MDYAFCVASNMFGPHDPFDEQTGHVIPTLMPKLERAIQTGGLVQIWGTGKPRRDFLCTGRSAGDADGGRAVHRGHQSRHRQSDLHYRHGGGDGACQDLPDP
jgi:nucleoside-diphosphate-sugar epimerase